MYGLRFGVRFLSVQLGIEWIVFGVERIREFTVSKLGVRQTGL